MRFRIATVIVLFLTGCSSEHTPYIGPTAPAPEIPDGTPGPPASTTGTALLWVMVVGENGACLDGGAIQLLSADGAGELIPQETPCNAWGYGGGITLRELTPGVAVRLRGTARGYTSRDATFLPFRVPGSYQVVSIELTRTR